MNDTKVAKIAKLSVTGGTWQPSRPDGRSGRKKVAKGLDVDTETPIIIGYGRAKDTDGRAAGRYSGQRAIVLRTGGGDGTGRGFDKQIRTRPNVAAVRPGRPAGAVLRHRIAAKRQ